MAIRDNPPRRKTLTVVGLISAFLLFNLAALCFFYGAFPFNDADGSSDDVPRAELNARPHVARSFSAATIQDSHSDVNQPRSMVSSLLGIKQMLPSRPTCSTTSSADSAPIVFHTSKSGPFPNQSQKTFVLASLNLLDTVKEALEASGICSWLDGESLLGAYHHGTPLPYTSGIELGIMLHDLPAALTALKFGPNGQVPSITVAIEEDLGVSRLSVAPVDGDGQVFINLYPASGTKFRLPKKPFTMNTGVVFPLQKASLAGRIVSVPQDTETYLRTLFGAEFQQHPWVLDWRTMSYVAPTTKTHAEYYPLVSIVIVTHERYEFLPMCLELIRRQDYPNIEIVIVDDSEKPLWDTPHASLLTQGSIVYRHIAEGRKSIGEKRNLGVQLASGFVIAHWDDDDYFRDHRVSEQVAPILAGDVDMTVLEHHYYFHLPSKAFYIVKRTSAWGPHFGTFMFKRSLWEQGIRYPDTSLAEDYAFAEFALKKGATIRVLENDDGKHVYTRHFNTWEIEFNNYIAQVKKVPRPEFFSEKDYAVFTSITITPPKSKPPKHYAAAEITWNRPELRPGWRDPKQRNPRELELPENWKELQYPHYKHYHDGGLTTGEQVGIGIGVTGGVIVIGGTFLVGAFYYWRYRRRSRMEEGYIALSTEFNL